MRYGDRAGHGTLDRRLLEAGLGISVATLVRVFADHHPGSPAASVCPGCGYRYPDQVLDCPTNATVRPLLLKRRGEDREAVARLHRVQFEDLHKANASKVTRAARWQRPEPTTPAFKASSLFDLAGKDPVLMTTTTEPSPPTHGCRPAADDSSAVAAEHWPSPTGCRCRPGIDLREYRSPVRRACVRYLTVELDNDTDLTGWADAIGATERR